MKMTEIWVDKGNLRRTKSVQKTAPALADSDIRLAIEKFAMTANNVTYAVSGDTIGYWGFFPAEDNWGKVTVWGMADVTESNCADIKTGERIYGFFPMASHVDVTPGKISTGGFTDMVDYRQKLPALYNRYTRTDSEPEMIRKLENQRCLFFPLFVTSYLIADYFDDGNFFGAEQIIVGSVSSKTGFGLAKFLKSETPFKGKIIGLTSPGNVDFVKGLNACDQVITYGDETKLDASISSAYVDMSGNGPLRTSLHTHFGDKMVQSVAVGATHWETERSSGPLPGARPEFFFAPSQIEKRNADWGPGVVFDKAYTASAKLAAEVKDQITVETCNGSDDVQAIWLDLVENKISPKRGIMASL